MSKEVISLKEGEKLAQAALHDPQTICEALAPMMEEAGLITQEQVVRILGGEPS